MLMDTYEAGSKKHVLNDPKIAVQKIFDYKSTFGVVLSGNSTKLKTCSEGYMQANKGKMSAHIAQFVESLKVR